MNVQTERIEGHQARLTVEIEAERLEQAKRQAARKISREVNIRGFRKGRAPYKRVAQIVGEGEIIENAITAISPTLYKEALDQSGLTAAGLGDFVDFKLEPAPIFIYTLPLTPEVDLGDYLDVRLDYTPPIFDESQVESELRRMQLHGLKVLDDNVQVAELGHRARLSVESVFADDADPAQDSPEEAADDEDAASEDATDDSQAALPMRGDTFVTEEDTTVILDPNEDPFLTGFVENLVGAELGSDVIFELTIPEDDTDETIRGRVVEFVVTIRQIESLDIPALDDDFARNFADELGYDATDLAQLRAEVRESLLQGVNNSAEAEYARQVSLEIMEGSDIRYPQVALEEQIDSMVKGFEEQVRQQNLDLAQYLRFTGASKEDFREQFRERAELEMRHSLVMRELVDELDVVASDADVDAKRETMVASWGFGAEVSDSASKALNEQFRNVVVMDFVLAKLTALGRGEDLEAAVQARRDQAAEDLRRGRERVQRLQAKDEAEAVDAEDESEDGDGDSLPADAAIEDE